MTDVFSPNSRNRIGLNPIPNPMLAGPRVAMEPTLPVPRTYRRLHEAAPRLRGHLCPSLSPEGSIGVCPTVSQEQLCLSDADAASSPCASKAPLSSFIRSVREPRIYGLGPSPPSSSPMMCMDTYTLRGVFAAYCLFQMEDMHQTGSGGGAQSSHALHPGSLHVHGLGSSLNPIL